MTDRVWVAVDSAVRAGLSDSGVLAHPPTSIEDVEWLAATIADHVCATIPKSVYQAFRDQLDTDDRLTSAEDHDR